MVRKLHRGVGPFCSCMYVYECVYGECAYTCEFVCVRDHACTVDASIWVFVCVCKCIPVAVSVPMKVCMYIFCIHDDFNYQRDFKAI